MQTFKQKHEKQPYLCPQGSEAVINCKRDPNQISQCSGFVSKLSPVQHSYMLSHGGHHSGFVSKLSPGQHACSLSHVQNGLYGHLSPRQHCSMLSHWGHHSGFVQQLSPGQQSYLLLHSEFLSMSALVCRAVRAATMKSFIFFINFTKITRPFILIKAVTVDSWPLR